MNNISYLFSGIDKEKGFTEGQVQLLIKDIHSKTNIVFASSIPNDYERNNTHHNRILNWFKNINITFNKSYIIDQRIDSVHAKKILNEVIEVSNYIKTFALPNESFIRIEKDKFNIIGNYYEYEGVRL